MKEINTLIQLNEAKKAIDELIEKLKNSHAEDETDYRKLLIVLLSVIGALVVVGVIAFAVYRHISGDEPDELTEDEFDDDADEDDGSSEDDSDE